MESFSDDVTYKQSFNSLRCEKDKILFFLHARSKKTNLFSLSIVEQHAHEAMLLMLKALLKFRVGFACREMIDLFICETSEEWKILAHIQPVHTRTTKRTGISSETKRKIAKKKGNFSGVEIVKSFQVVAGGEMRKKPSTIPSKGR